ncbi:MAG TPA: hypothetical protein VKT82_20145 [Ktedonobacterales bacterium]|nr:hypothetical protein [Ktedonobacterales bacterium]
MAKVQLQGSARSRNPGFLGAFNVQTCACCGKKNIQARFLDCPDCLVPLDGQWPVEQKQLIRTYTGKDLGMQLQLDAQRLARYGWRLVNQSYGGQAGIGLVRAVAVGGRASRDAKQLTAVFERG